MLATIPSQAVVYAQRRWESTPVYQPVTLLPTLLSRNLFALFLFNSLGLLGSTGPNAVEHIIAVEELSPSDGSLPLTRVKNII